MQNLNELADQVYDVSCDIDAAVTLLQTIRERHYGDRELDSLLKQSVYIGNYRNTSTLLSLLSEILYKNRDLLSDMSDELSGIQKVTQTGGGLA